MKSLHKPRASRQQVDPVAIREMEVLIADLPKKRDLLLEYLHRIQDHYRCISSRHINALAKVMSISRAEIYEVATFYHHFDVIGDEARVPPEITVRVCVSMTCAMFGSETLMADLRNHYGQDVRIQAVPCVGRCHAAPVAVVGMNPVEKATMPAVAETVTRKQIQPPVSGYINHDQYRTEGGYRFLQDCLQGKHDRSRIIDTLEDAGLRGLGGAGFPAGRKWKILLEKPKPKLIAVNIDEGEPGTFKDRYFLERDPHRFIEGALIASWVIDAEAVYIYLRDEYAGCRRILQQELDRLKADPPCPLPAIHLRRGAGAYVCGEESAMIESIEGKRGMPRLRPPYVADIGLFNLPTLEHNMETLHWVRDILENGATWFTSHGRNGRKGLRAFSVSGRINKPGVHLAPAGITIRELIDEYCGGMLPGHKFYGYFPGGASGGILPASLDKLPLDFDTLQSYGCFIGSAAIVVLSDQDSARSMALNAMRFFEDESCGQCTPCRVGTSKAVSLMECEHWDTSLLEELARAMEDASICGLGQAAPNPLRCAIKYFPEEFH